MRPGFAQRWSRRAATRCAACGSLTSRGHRCGGAPMCAATQLGALASSALLSVHERLRSLLQGRNRQCITLDLHKEEGRNLVNLTAD